MRPIETLKGKGGNKSARYSRGERPGKLDSPQMAARRASEAPHARQDSTLLERASASVSAILSVAASAKVAKYAHRIPYSFSPFVVSIGGSLDAAALKALQDWRTSLSPASMDWLMCRLSLVLLKARAHSWAF